MKVNSHKLKSPNFPSFLANIPNPPQLIYYLGQDPTKLMRLPRIGIVGSRKPTSYGRDVTYRFARDLASRGLVVVSGLAYGIDSIAHQAALDAGGLSVAVLPGSVEEIYPAGHRALAAQIVECGGCLISEYPKNSQIMAHNFIARNRIISGLSDALLIPQAAKHSGSLHTANFALEQGRSVLAIPGPITEAMCEGTNNLIKTGATPVTTLEDIFAAMGLKPTVKKAIRLFKGSREQRTIYELIGQGMGAQEELIERSGLDSASFNSALTQLELSGYIRAGGGGHWTLA